MVIIIGTMHKKASQIVLILGPGNELVKEWIKILFCLVKIVYSLKFGVFLGTFES